MVLDEINWNKRWKAEIRTLHTLIHITNKQDSERVMAILVELNQIVDRNSEEDSEEYSPMPLIRPCIVCGEYHDANRERNSNDWLKLCEKCLGDETK